MAGLASGLGLGLNYPAVGVPVTAYSYSASSLAVPTGFTFARASTGTFLGSNGLMQTAAINTARFEYDAGARLLGLLIEEGKTNFARVNRAFDNAYWTKSQILAFGSGSIANTTETTDPFGANEADKIVWNTTTASHFFNRSGLSTSNAVTTASIFVKSAGWQYVNLTVIGSVSGGSYRATFDVINGTVSATGTVGANATFSSADIQALPNGWYHISVTGTADTGAGTCNFLVGAAIAGSIVISGIAGDGTSGNYFYGAQFETGVLTSYIPNDSSAADVARSGDILTGAISGLPWFNSVEGTVQSTYLRPTGRIFQFSRYVDISDGTTNNRLLSFFDTATSTVDLRVDAAAVEVANISSGNQVPLAGGIINPIFRYQVDNYAIRTPSLDGPTVSTDTSGAMPTGFTIFQIGVQQTNILQPNNHLQSLRYWDTALTDTQIRALR